MRCRSSVLANLKPKSVGNFIGKALIEIAKYFTAAFCVIFWGIAKFWSWYAGFFSSYLTQWHWCEYNQSNNKGAQLEKLQFYANENERNFFLNCPTIFFASTPYVTCMLLNISSSKNFKSCKNSFENVFDICK